MKVLEAGHRYLVDTYDWDGVGKLPEQIIEFMKREGAGYPGNKGHHSGTNCQELTRVLIDRTIYLNNQYSDQRNEAAVMKFREGLWLFEDRAAERHGFAPHDVDFRPDDIETESHCTTCGHILCKGH